MRQILKEDYTMDNEKNILKSNLENFKDNKVWVTKKIRMDAEERMKLKNNIINYFLIYYSASLAVMSFLTLYNHHGFDISLFSSMIALVLPSANIYQYKANYSQKEEQYRRSYTALSKLESEIDTYLTNGTIDNNAVCEFKNRYEDILTKYDNHETIDYKLFLLKKDKDKLSKIDKSKIYFWKVIIFLMTASILLFPVILILIKLISIM